MEMLRLSRGYPRCIYCRAGGLWAEPHLRWAAGRTVRAPVTQVNGETEDFSPTIALSKTTRNDIHKGSRSLTQRDILATMPYLGVCCANLKDNKALMKMGLGLVLVGHVNFLLGALVHGAVLRHINVHEQARTMVYAIANVIAIVAGLFGIIDGIITIVLSKNKKNKILRWVLLFFSFLVGLLAIASAIGLSVSTVQAIIHKGKSLLTHCNFPDEIDSARITFECPFDPTRIYATTLILWIPLIVMSVVETVFAFRCFAVCTSSLYLCACRKKPLQARRVRIQQNVESVPAPPETEEEPAEEDELLDGDTAVAQSDWL